ncbi:MAG TPA: hypothetical protein VNQ76_00415 [Planctomicrobium sp.]|nr:hypothetical protein [Planctomicrobium sp.]
MKKSIREIAAITFPTLIHPLQYRPVNAARVDVIPQFRPVLRLIRLLK